MDQKALRYKVEFLFSYHYITLQQGDGMNAPLVKVEVRGRVGLLTLDRPKALNALSNEVIDELSAALRAFDADENIGAIVLTGSEKAFAAGADICYIQGWSCMDVYRQD